MSEPTARASESPAPAAEEHRFQAEVNQVLDIVIHSLYSHREIFLRELISNASDALDQLRFRAVTEHGLLGDDQELEIRLVPDAAEKSLSIADNGVGMDREELIANLGTIAHSGTRRLLGALREKGQTLDLIGQFGVGFYSAFLVARKVEVRSRKAGTDAAWRWTSEARGTFTVEPAPEKATRGTEVTLFLAEEYEEFLERARLEELVRKYSDFVGHSIRLKVGVGEGEGAYATINKASALWRRPRAEIREEDYEELYRHLTGDGQKPLARTHFTVEGAKAFTALLFVPRDAPFDLFDRTRRGGLRLYVKRVLIMESCEDLLPEWLRFVRGVVDSDDLPLNVSRELLQEDRAVRSMRKSLVAKVLSLLEQVARERPDDYRTLWEAFGTVLKEGIHFDPEARERLAALLRASSTAEEHTSLADYVSRMKPGQDAIYFVTGTSRKAVEGSPHMEALRRRGIEVLYFTDTIDEWVVEGLREFEGKPLRSVMKADLALDTEESVEERKRSGEREEELKGLIDAMEDELSEQVREVRLSRRLVESPCCLVVPEGGLHAHIERLLRAQHKDLPVTKRILELNPDHPIVERLRARQAAGPNDASVKEWIRLLYEQALVAEGSPIPDPQGFARRVSRLLSEALGASAGGTAAGG